ncbi:peptidoglycan/xylan/chitin deacetylase (PgdA/CDA1 family) [Kitasatospora sp. MAP12-15]|uniref:polysaccharide deacetylase family protein n=1 Tax=unclassified Kitasatospora TaxID=2633591 RepID=UPI002472EB3A|nr:polysaccharide deacetylase family protein [Kitasatospora sp. MAP12-44]MDH6109497.1 peptidoglycan/xylan/chitin deacetylase (PgdA/CDA1 family) [Kitasatospora sp. MAP12-44]
MTINRRRILRTATQLAALTAAGAVLPSCGKEATATASRPLTTSFAAPGRPPLAPDAPGAPTVAPALTRLQASEPAQPAQLASPAATAPAAPTPPVLVPLADDTPFEVVNGPRDRQQIALTFHGQGDPELATAILQAAEQHGAKVTVLAVGTWLEEQPQMARRILDGGHELGNHTQNHLDICSMSPDQAYDEIAECADHLKELTGSIGRWFRPSAAQYATATVKEQARKVGYEHCLSFGLDPRDYSDPGADVVQRRILGSVRAGSIVALHMGHQGTVDALPNLLDALSQRGLTAVTASELLS